MINLQRACAASRVAGIRSTARRALQSRHGQARSRKFLLGIHLAGLSRAHGDLRALQLRAASRRRSRYGRPRRTCRRALPSIASASRAACAATTATTRSCACSPKRSNATAIPEARAADARRRRRDGFQPHALRDVRRTARLLHARRLGRRTHVRADLRFQRSGRARARRRPRPGAATDQHSARRARRRRRHAAHLSCRKTSLRRFGIPEAALRGGRDLPGLGRSRRASSVARARELLRTAATKCCATSRGARRPACRRWPASTRSCSKKIERDPALAAARARRAFKDGEIARRRAVVALERVAVVGGGLAGLAAALASEGRRHRTSSSSSAAGCSAAARRRSRSTASRSTTDSTSFWRAAPSSSPLRARVGMDGRTATCKIASTRGSSRATAAAAGCAPAYFPRRCILLASFATLSAPFARRETPHRARPCSVAAIAASARRSETFEAWLRRNGPRRRRAPRVLGSVFHSGAQRAVRSRRRSRCDCSCCRRRSCAMPGRRASASRRCRSRISPQAAAAKLDAVHASTAVLARGVRRSPTASACHPALVDGRLRGRSTPSCSPCRRAKSRGSSATRRATALRTSTRTTPYPIVDVHLWHDGGSIGFDFAAALDSPLQWIFEKAPGYLCCSFSAADEYLLLPTAAARSARVE